MALTLTDLVDDMIPVVVNACVYPLPPRPGLVKAQWILLALVSKHFYRIAKAHIKDRRTKPEWISLVFGFNCDKDGVILTLVHSMTPRIPQHWLHRPTRVPSAALFHEWRSAFQWIEDDTLMHMAAMTPGMTPAVFWTLFSAAAARNDFNLLPYVIRSGELAMVQEVITLQGGVRVGGFDRHYASVAVLHWVATTQSLPLAEWFKNSRFGEALASDAAIAFERSGYSFASHVIAQKQVGTCFSAGSDAMALFMVCDWQLPLCAEGQADLVRHVGLAALKQMQPYWDEAVMEPQALLSAAAARGDVAVLKWVRTLVDID